MRAKNIEVQDVNAHQYNTLQHKAISDYRAARKDGIQPESLTPQAVRQAREISDRIGRPYRADQR